MALKAASSPALSRSVMTLKPTIFCSYLRMKSVLSEPVSGLPGGPRPGKRGAVRLTRQFL